MGVLVDDVEMAVDCWGTGDDDVDVVLSLGRGDPALHNGISLGRFSDPAARIGRVAALMNAALTSEAAFASAVEALPTVNSGPFPGVVPATWWASLTSAQKSKCHRAVLMKVAHSSLA